MPQTRELRLAVFSGRLHGLMAFLSAPKTGHSYLNEAEDEDDDFDGLELEPLSHPHLKRKIITAALPRPAIPVQRRPGQPDAEHLIQTLTIVHCSRLINYQNHLAAVVLAKGNRGDSWRHLRALTLFMWDLAQPELARLLATHFPELRELHIGLCHPYIHDQSLPWNYWTHPGYLVPSTVWDCFGVGGDAPQLAAGLRLRKLEKLTLQRASTSCAQLQRWIRANPDLVDLSLHCVSGVNVQFVNWLGRYYGSCSSDVTIPREEHHQEAGHAKLRTLALESCHSLALESVEDLSWLDGVLFPVTTPGQDAPAPAPTPEAVIDSATAFQILSFRDCPSVSSAAVVQYLALKRPAVRQVVLPDSRVLVETATAREDDGGYNPAIHGYLSRRAQMDAMDLDEPSPVPYLRFLPPKRHSDGEADEPLEVDPRRM